MLPSSIADPWDRAVDDYLNPVWSGVKPVSRITTNLLTQNPINVSLTNLKILLKLIPEREEATMPVRFRIRTDGGGEYLADHVDRLGHRRAKHFESREAAEAFLKKVQNVDLSRKASTPSVEADLVEDAA